MVQVWILRRDMLPTEAVARGLDSAICGDCKHRGAFNPATGKHGSARTCYVNVGQAPQQVYRTWQRGQYPRLKLAGYAQAFAGRSIRLGAYGDPVHIPLAMVAELARVTIDHTGYTHQWRDAALAGYMGHLSWPAVILRRTTTWQGGRAGGRSEWRRSWQRCLARFFVRAVTKLGIRQPAKLAICATARGQLGC